MTDGAEVAVTESTAELGRLVDFGELGLPAKVVGALEGQGIFAPTPIQRLVVPDILAGRDVCGRAATGSGKTLAFGLPTLVRLRPGDGVGALILVPTRELAAQVTEALSATADVLGLKVEAVFGGTPMRAQIARVNRGPEALVATPGRLLDLRRRGVVDLAGVRIVVIDEADQMADMGFMPQVRDVMRDIPRGHQTLLFSATLDGQVAGLIRDYMTDPVIQAVETSFASAQDHRFLRVHHLDKAKVAARIIRSARRSLVFVATKRGADRVAAALAAEGIEVARTHGDLPQEHRERSLSRFMEGQIEALVATNVAARGLHVDNVDVVIHYDPPDDYKTFLHRSGRTARNGETGLVVTLVEWDQVLAVERLQRSSGFNTEIVQMFSNDPRLDDLASFRALTRRLPTVADFSRRAGRRR